MSEKNNKKFYADQQLFFYTINHLRILIDADIKMEVLAEATIYPIPHAPLWYKGSSSVRGSILPVIDTHLLFGLTQGKNQRQWLLKLEHPKFSPIILVIDHLPSQINLNKLASLAKNTHIHYPSWIQSSATQHGKTFLFADHHSLFEALKNNKETALILSDSDYFHTKMSK
jgi:chemotaxis signal transduction protein